MLSGRATHCGCKSAARSAENLRTAVAKNTRHGAAVDGKHTPEYRSWHAMQERCHNPNNNRYASYGGCGIHVADEWRGKGGFERFLAHIGPRPSPHHSVDRFPNRDGSYEPNNVRWATLEEQAENRDCTIYLDVDGERLSLAEWSRRCGLSQSTLQGRIRLGWNGRDIVTKPARVTARLARRP